MSEASQQPGESHEDLLPEPDPLVQEKIALERELLDPTTDLERLYEIHKRAKELANVQVPREERLDAKTDEELAKMLSDKSTPYDVLEDIGRIIERRKRGEETLPRSDN